ncbi:hypothetical protein ACN47E_005970 [Coniothyrium glycines]
MTQNDEAKRATTFLAIAQVKFRQALKKEDQEERLPSVSADASSQFFADLDAVLKQNTRVNVQKCTEWIVRHIAPSRARIAALGDYLMSVSKSIVVDQQEGTAAKKAARNRIDLLLIVNDVLHTDKFHRRSTTKQATFSQDCVLFVTGLIEQAAAFIAHKDAPAEKKLRALINYWTVNQLLDAAAINACRTSADEGLYLAQGGLSTRKRNYLLPDYHGDRTAPWHDLPAAYMLEQMIQNPKRPIDPTRIKIAKLDKKPASPHVHKLLDNFFENMDLKYAPTGDNPTGDTSKYKLWLDPIGQTVKLDKDTGSSSTVCNGYGWSMKFCQDMQRYGVPENIKMLREDAERLEATQDLRELPRQHREERRQYNSPPFRRRDSSSERGFRRERTRRNHSRSRHGSESSYDSRRSYSRSRSRDRSRDQRGGSPSDRRHHSHDRSHGHGDGRNSQPRPPPKSSGRGPTQTGSQWHNPGHASHDQQHNPTGPQNPVAPPQPPQNMVPPPPFTAPPFAFQPPPPGQFTGQFPFIPPPPGQFQGGFVPPPPPPNFTGPYPPPPPNMTAMPHAPFNLDNQQAQGYGNQFGFGNNAQYRHNQGSHQAGRGGYGGHQNGRGAYGGSSRGQRGGRY